MRARMLVLVAVALVIAPLARGQDAVTLKRTVRLEPGGPLVLGDLALLRGPGAAGLADVVVVQDPRSLPTDARGWRRVGLEAVEAAVGERLGEAAGLVAISGSGCDVLIRARNEPGAAPEAGSAEPAAAPSAADLVPLSTVRGAVARELARLLRADPTAMRLSFEPEDREFLDLSTVGYVLDISTAGASERLPVVVARYDAAGRERRRTVRVGVEIRRSVAHVARVVARGQVIEAADVTTESRWVSPADSLVSPAEAVGAVAQRKLDPGQLVEAHMVEPPVVVRRNDLVEVRVFGEGLVVSRLAHALGDGREGDTIDFAIKDNPRQRVRATVVGPGQATVTPPPSLGAGTAVANGRGAG